MGLPPFSAEDLEQALAATSNNCSKDVKPLLVSIHSSILRRMVIGGKQSHDVQEDSWEGLLRQKLKERYSELWSRNPLPDSLPYASLAPKVKAQVLRALTEWALEDHDRVAAWLEGNKANPELLRAQPLGSDSQDRVYWYLGDTDASDVCDLKCWLFRESVPSNANGRGLGPFSKRITSNSSSSSWETVCTRLEEMEALRSSIKGSKDKRDQALRKALDLLLPDIQAALQSQERAFRKRLMLEALLANQKKSSRLESLATKRKQQEQEQEQACLIIKEKADREKRLKHSNNSTSQPQRSTRSLRSNPLHLDPISSNEARMGAKKEEEEEDDDEEQRSREDSEAPSEQEHA